MRITEEKTGRARVRAAALAYARALTDAATADLMRIEQELLEAVEADRSRRRTSPSFAGGVE